MKFKLSKLEVAFLLFCFIFYFIWAVSKPFNYAPDEYMRYEVSKYLYENNRLPIGTELLSDLWGFSYAHLPTMLCNLLSFIPMKIVGLTTQSEFALVVAARMVSVLCGVGVVYFIIKTANLLFGAPMKWIMVIFVSMIPQFVFLSSYLNNDIVALLGCSMILYSWVYAMKYNWTLIDCIILALGISICALAYYNSYGWILCSIIFFIGSYLFQNQNNYKGLIKWGLIISLIVIFCISYMFVRHLVLYGDLLGLNTIREYGELYAVDSLKPSNRVSIQKQGISLYNMLFGSMSWIKITYESFIEYFGYMNVQANIYVYSLYKLFFGIGFVGFFLRLMICCKYYSKKVTKQKILFYSCIVICVIIPVFLSIYNSYTYDYQPQGRYCYPAILSLAILISKGIETFLEKISKLEIQYAIVGILSTVLFMITLSEFFVTYLPS